MTPEDEPISADDLMSAEPAKKPAKAKTKALGHPVLSDDDVLRARQQARDEIEAEKRKAAMDRLVKEEKERLRVEEGLTTGDQIKDQIVNITIDLPPFADKLLINGPMGMAYYHGKTYTVPRHVADTLNEMMFRAWRHEDQVDGKDLRQTYARKWDSKMNGVTGASHSAPQRMTAEPTGPI